jgi:hypothetical protein
MSGRVSNVMRRRTFEKTRVVARRRYAMAGCAAALCLVALAVAAATASAVAVSGNCYSASRCRFPASGDYFLQAYGSQPNDRIAYGYYHGTLIGVEGFASDPHHMCVGAKSGSDGGGNNVGPLGVTCSPNPETDFTIFSASGTSGYSTVINAVHAAACCFYGLGWR